MTFQSSISDIYGLIRALYLYSSCNNSHSPKTAPRIIKKITELRSS